MRSRFKKVWCEDCKRMAFSGECPPEHRRVMTSGDAQIGAYSDEKSGRMIHRCVMDTLGFEPSPRELWKGRPIYVPRKTSGV